MQNRTFLLLFRPIFGEKLKTVPPKGNWVPKLWCRCRDSVWKSVWISDFGLKIRLNFGVDLFFFVLETTCFWAEKLFDLPILAEKSDSISVKTFFFFFWRPPVFERRKRLNFRAFREIPFQISDKPWETDSRTMKIWVKFLCTFLTLSKEPPPLFPNPGYAPDPNI